MIASSKATESPETGAKLAPADGKALMSGGAILAMATFAANAGNYLLNVFLGRWMSPAEFADANLMVTLMLLITAVAVSLQLIAARFASQYGSDKRAVANRTAETAKLFGLQLRLNRWARTSGVALAAIFALGAPLWSELFNTADSVPFVILGLGMPAYLVQSVGRGVLQGRFKFSCLAQTFLIEATVRVLAAVGLVAAGLGVTGATLALTASFVATWAAVGQRVRREMPSASMLQGVQALGDRSTAAEMLHGLWPNRPNQRGHRDPAVLAYAGPVAIVLVGQIVINNGDVLISKYGLAPTTAGIYAAIALVGRAVFFLSWSVTTTMFPAVARKHHLGQDPDGLLYVGLVVVAVLGLIAAVGARSVGGVVLGTVFGPEYGGISGPLARYAVATSMFALANLIVSHHLALGRIREALIMVGGAILQTALLLSATKTIEGLIDAQILAMAGLVSAVGMSHLARSSQSRHTETTALKPGVQI